MCFCTDTNLKFDKYEKAYTSQVADLTSSAASGRCAPSNLSRNGSTSSLIARATESRRAREQLSNKEARAELNIFLAEDLLYVDEGSSPEQQATSVFAWWKVCSLNTFVLLAESQLYLIFNISGKYSSVSHPGLHRT
jgi:hypothetical protein